MSTFAVEAHTIEIAAHDNADSLELARVGGYVSCVVKDQFKSGDLAIYIPEAAIVPENILRDISLWDEAKNKGRLAGPDGNRVKAARLRGVVSQGLIYKPEGLDLEKGRDYAQDLGIAKWEPPIPAALAGNVHHAVGITTYTDIENVKRFTSVLRGPRPRFGGLLVKIFGKHNPASPGEEVVMTEKLHGTCLIAFHDGDSIHVSSKGMAAKSLALEDARNEKGQRTNFYWRCLDDVRGESALEAISKAHGGKSVTLYGEGLPCQDLKYGLDMGHPTMLAFDLKIDGQYLDYDVFLDLMAEHSIPVAPPLYRGPFSQEALDTYTNGTTTIGEAKHVREGVVVKPTIERRDEELGRVILKSISPAYLTRKGDATEFN